MERNVEDEAAEIDAALRAAMEGPHEDLTDALWAEIREDATASESPERSSDGLSTPRRNT